MCLVVSGVFCLYLVVIFVLEINSGRDNQMESLFCVSIGFERYMAFLFDSGCSRHVRLGFARFDVDLYMFSKNRYKFLRVCTIT